MEKCKQIIVDAGKDMLKRSLTVGTWGNLSVRDPETGNIIVTPSGMNYESCVCGDMVVFDKDGNLIEGQRRPTIEKDMHIKIYQNRADINAIVHTHPLYSTVFCVTEQSIPPITEEFAQIIGRTVNCAKYALPGTQELADYAVEALGEQSAVLLTSHGTVCVGVDMATAFKVCDVLEKAAQILILSKAVGQARIIPDEDIEAMQQFVKTKYGQR